MTTKADGAEDRSTMAEAMDWSLVQIVAIRDIAEGRRPRARPDLAGIAQLLSSRLDALALAAGGAMRQFSAATARARKGLPVGDWTPAEHLCAFVSHHPSIRARAALDLEEVWDKDNEGLPVAPSLIKAVAAPLDPDSRQSRQAGWLSVQIRDLLSISTGQEPEFMPDWNGIADLLEHDVQAHAMAVQSVVAELCSDFAALAERDSLLLRAEIEENLAFLRLSHPAMRRTLLPTVEDLWREESGSTDPVPEKLVEALAD